MSKQSPAMVEFYHALENNYCVKTPEDFKNFLLDILPENVDVKYFLVDGNTNKTDFYIDVSSSGEDRFRGTIFLTIEDISSHIMSLTQINGRKTNIPLFKGQIEDRYASSISVLMRNQIQSILQLNVSNAQQKAVDKATDDVIRIVYALVEQSMPLGISSIDPAATLDLK